MLTSDRICQKAVKLLTDKGCRAGFLGVFETDNKWIFVSSRSTGSYGNVAVYVDRETEECDSYDWFEHLVEIKSARKLPTPEKYRLAG